MRQFQRDNVTDREFANKTVEAQRNALKKGVVLFIATIYD